MPTTSPFCLSHLPTAGPSNQNHLPIPYLLIWEDKPSPLLGYLLFLRFPAPEPMFNFWSQVRKNSDWAQMLGDKGIGVETTSSVWVPRGQGYRSCLSKPASAHQREPGDRDHEGKSRVFSAEAAKQDYTPKPRIQGWGEKGAQTGKGLTRSEAKKLGAEQQYKMWYLLSGQAVQGSHCDFTRKHQRLVFTCH